MKKKKNSIVLVIPSIWTQLGICKSFSIYHWTSGGKRPWFRYRYKRAPGGLSNRSWANWRPSGGLAALNYTAIKNSDRAVEKGEKNWRAGEQKSRTWLVSLPTLSAEGSHPNLFILLLFFYLSEFPLPLQISGLQTEPNL